MFRNDVEVIDSILSAKYKHCGVKVKLLLNMIFFCLIRLQAVDVVGQAGKPKAITGFQTHTTPVLLAHGERAELATEEYLPVTPILEGFVILRKNPNYET